jgi:hypothetical protein
VLACPVRRAIRPVYPLARSPQIYQLLVAADPHTSMLENSRDQFDDEFAQVVVVLDV